MKVASLDLEHQPYPLLDIPADATKNAKGAKLLLIPELAKELREWITETGRQGDDLLFHVPDDLNLIFQRDRKAAGIPKKTARVALLSSVR